MIASNDDWGFNTQTFLPPDAMRKYVFPWHRKIVRAAHDAGIPAALHSCGNPFEILDDVIYDMKFDARHSYEDKIMPVEQFYTLYHDKLAILGGMDFDFVTRGTPEQIRERSKNMLNIAKTGYALGTGNSHADAIPDENFFAMLKSALD